MKAPDIRVLHYFPAAVGGTPAAVVELARAQRALGCRVTIVSREPLSTAASQLLADGTVLDAHVGFPCLGPAPSPAGVRILRDLVATVDVVHLHGMWELGQLVIAEIAARKGVPYVLTPHGMLSQWAMAQKRTKKRVALRLGFGRLIRKASALHALTTRELELMEHVPPDANVIVIPNGVDVETFSDLPARGEFRRAHPDLGTSPFILFMSRLHPEKGLDLLAEAFARMHAAIPDVRLVVIGPDAGARVDFEARIAALGVADRVHLLGPIYDRTKFAAMVDCAAYCLPSRHEAFSMAIVEAMACGAPTVITTHCNFDEPGRAGAALVVDLDVDRIADALVSVLTDGDRARAMGARGRQFVFEGYAWPIIAERMVSAYASIITRPARAASVRISDTTAT